MFHTDRHWCVQTVHSREELAEKLLDYSWCGCCGFDLEGHLWLNDSTSPDALQEYAVVRRPTGDSKEYRQVESITVSWCDRQQLLDYIGQIHHGEPGVGKGPVETGPVVHARSTTDLFRALGVEETPTGMVVHLQIETPALHGCCNHCS